MDEFGKFIEREMLEEAERVVNDLELDLCSNQPMPEQTDEMSKGLYRKIGEYEDDKVIARLSYEARQTLMLGRKYIKDQKEWEEEQARRKSKRRKKMRFSFAAAAVLALAIGVPSLGEPKKIIEVMQQAVGGRIMSQVDSDSEKTKKSGESKEEAAYQQIKDEIGIDPVRIVKKPENMEFSYSEIDNTLRTATLLYHQEDKKVRFFISCTYVEESLSIDIEDKLLQTYEYPLEKAVAEIKEFQLSGEEQIRQEVRFSYKDIHYRLVSDINKSDLELILKNLYFL